MARKHPYTLTVETIAAHIIEGCIAKDARSQELLYKIAYPEMMKVCYRYTFNFNDAAALYNEAMLKVFNKAQQYKFEGSFNGWVKRVVINTCIDACRKKISFDKQWLDEAKAENIAINPDVYGTIEAKEIIELIATLPKNTATVFNLFVLDGYKHSEIAQVIGISEGTSKWHLNEARRLLKIKLEALDKDIYKVGKVGK